MLRATAHFDIDEQEPKPLERYTWVVIYCPNNEYNRGARFTTTDVALGLRAHNWPDGTVFEHGEQIITIRGLVAINQGGGRVYINVPELCTATMPDGSPCLEPRAEHSMCCAGHRRQKDRERRARQNAAAAKRRGAK